MYQVDFNRPIRVHFIGIGGISMSGLAEILMHNKFNISGSDMNPSDIIEHLRTLGAAVQIGHHGDHIDSSVDLVVYTAAIKVENPEYQKALGLDIPMIDRAELLGQIMDNYPCSIGIAGTHGKTTTTSMVSKIMMDAQLDPTVSVGGMLDTIGGNIRVGKSEYFITEACEYANSFLKFRPYLGIILNVEEDHLDFFSGIDEIRASFRHYLENIPANGYAVINTEIPDYAYLVSGLPCKIITYGKAMGADWSAVDITFDDAGHASFTLQYHNEPVMDVYIAATGIHNVYNALASFAAAHALGLPLEGAKSALESFSPPKRRFEYKGSLLGVTVIDDYAHHPTEIETTLQAAQNLRHNKLWVVFQPHTYSRTKSFLQEFAQALSLADGVIVTDIYAAREKDPGDIHARDLVNALSKIHPNSHYISSFDDIEIFLLENCIPEDVLITMGAGNVYLIAEDLLRG